MKCCNCKKEYEIFMLKNEVWIWACRSRINECALIFGGGGGVPLEPFIDTTGINYCKQCVELAIGRKLVKEDFADVNERGINEDT